MQPCHLEEHFLLRLPPSLASLLTGSLVESNFASPDGLRIRFVSPRVALVQHPRFIKPGYPAILCDCPAVMETLKNPTISVDYNVQGDDDSASADANANANTQLNNDTPQKFSVGQYYKVADVNQLLLVLDVDSPDGQKTLSRLPPSIQQRLLRLAAPNPDEAFESLRAAAAASHEEEEEALLASLPWTSLPDGLTPPLRNALKRRFAPRPVHAGDVGDLERVEREVERLLRADAEAVESSFTLFSPSGEVLLGGGSVAVAAVAAGDVEEETGTALKDNLVEQQQQVDDQKTETAPPLHSDHKLVRPAAVVSTVVVEDESVAGDEEDSDVMDDFAAEIEDNLMRLDESDVEADEVVDAEANEVVEGLSDGFSAVTEGLPAVIDASSPPPQQQSELLSTRPPPSLSSAVTELEQKLQEKLKQAATVTNPLIKARIEDVIRQLEDNLKKLRESEGEQ